MSFTRTAKASLQNVGPRLGGATFLVPVVAILVAALLAGCGGGGGGY